MELRPYRFGDIDSADKRAIAPWVRLIPEDLHCKIATYAKCEEVGDFKNGLVNIDYSMPIGFVLSGKVEICESYEFLDMTAYRPIRLLSQGELFGDFSFLDAELGCKGATRRGESWKIQAGARSVLITQKISSDNEHFITDGSITKPHLIVPLVIQEGARVLFIDGGLVGDCRAKLVDHVLRYSWVRAKIYRDCLNSFNFNELLLFKEKAYRVHADLISRSRTGGGRQYTKAVSKDAILDVFLDAVWDACNRPLRNEPLFESQLGAPLLSSQADRLNLTGVRAENIYLASTSWEAKKPLLFPVGSHNFMIGAYAKAALENPARKRRESIRKNIERVFHRQNQQRASNEKPANEFYLDLANKLISKEIVPQYSVYPYSVICKEIQGTHSKIMVLEFTNKGLLLDG